MKHQDHLKTLSDDYKRSYGFDLPWQIPDYAPVEQGDWSVRSRLGGLSGSYLAHQVVEPPHSVLFHGRDVWMSTALLEVESHAWHLQCAKGNLLVAGLGMGMYVHAASMKPEVKRIAVIERDPDVIALMKESTRFETWVHSDKVTMIEADAMASETEDMVAAAFNGERPDYLYADIWPVFPAPKARRRRRGWSINIVRGRQAGGARRSSSASGWNVGASGQASTPFASSSMPTASTHRSMTDTSHFARTRFPFSSTTIMEPDLSLRRRTVLDPPPRAGHSCRPTAGDSIDCLFLDPDHACRNQFCKGRR
ncbi:hypothetical protein [Rhizobium sp. BK176]|uniref:hypothetical protein n=1 Tax=Rhizobium sp. BK176 TaxID=2587071 RepID=UPI00216A9738|nr:hypothetical protein [Rhizobium sp. BK176]MCS4089355.1 hypothetical protein [Rhizobium sp. BK176]